MMRRRLISCGLTLCVAHAVVSLLWFLHVVPGVWVKACGLILVGGGLCLFVTHLVAVYSKANNPSREIHQP